MPVTLGTADRQGIEGETMMVKLKTLRCLKCHVKGKLAILRDFERKHTLVTCRACGETFDVPILG